MLAARVPVRAAQRGRIPVWRFAVVGAATFVFAVLLGVGGAFGYASSSLHTFGSNVEHIVTTSNGNNPNGGSGTFDGKKGDGGNTNGECNGNWNGDDHPDGCGNQGGCRKGDNYDQQGGDNDPFHHQYGICVPICHDGNIIFVPLREYFYRLLRGDRPARFCFAKPG